MEVDVARVQRVRERDKRHQERHGKGKANSSSHNQPSWLSRRTYQAQVLDLAAVGLGQLYGFGSCPKALELVKGANVFQENVNSDVAVVHQDPLPGREAFDHGRPDPDLDEALWDGCGLVSRTFVEPGEYVEAGQRIALLHDQASVYVEANIRETDIRRVAPGQPVRIEVDAYPGRALEGWVLRVGEAATSQFALLPDPNPSGHFTKVTQRLPVRIEVEQASAPLRPGMMVEVFIDVGRE